MAKPAQPGDAPDQALRKAWVEMGCETPPAHRLKVAALRAYGTWSRARVFIETGTFRGETTAAMQPYFEKIYSIELAPKAAERARQMFKHKPNIQIIEGDSGVRLRELLTTINERCVLWLDAHWCGPETAGEILSAAIIPELEAVLAHPVRDHVILIDDARYFVGSYGYPSVERLRRMVAEHRPDFVFDVAMDSIRIHAPNPPTDVPAA